MLKNIQMIIVIIEDFYVYIQHMCRIKILHLPYMKTKDSAYLAGEEGGQTNNFFHQTEGD